jgi:hypothetical protein
MTGAFGFIPWHILYRLRGYEYSADVMHLGGFFRLFAFFPARN